MKEKVIRFLNTFSVFLSGSLLSSLWITHSDSWKIYLPILLTAITARNFFKT